jgi:hypothetical protein
LAQLIIASKSMWYFFMPVEQALAKDEQFARDVDHILRPRKSVVQVHFAVSENSMIAVKNFQ